MDWTIQDLGAAGEFVGSIAVVVTLGFLVLQLRQHAGIMRAQTRSNLTDQILHVNATLAGNAHILRAQRKDLAGQPLDEDETLALRVVTVMWFRHAENVHYQYRCGLYDEGEFHAHETIWRQRWRNEPSIRRVWLAQRQAFAPQFRRYADEVMEIDQENVGPA